ncbi:uncharacterized protein ACRADG_008461 [Cochliomyia hominivorax]
MLKILTPTNLFSSRQTKCGEIFYQNFNKFFMVCTFCEMKFFQYEEFFLHVQNTHLEDCLQIDFENEDEMDKANDEHCVDEEHLMEDSNLEEENSSNEEEFLTILQHFKGEYHANEENKITNEEKLETQSPQPAKSKKIPKAPVVFTCSDCKQTFPYRKVLDEHMFECHNGYKCSLCDNRFRLPHHLRRHEQLHSSEKFACPIEQCGKLYKSPEYLKHHMEVHTLSKTFVCEFEDCSKAFESERRLNAHYDRSHGGEFSTKRRKKNAFVCDSCGLVCWSNAILSRHLLLHTGEKAFACEVCGKRFALKGYLTLHMERHKNNRKYVCGICQAGFNSSDILQRHKYIHLDKKLFQCKLCDKSFKQPHGLDGHMRRLHMEPKEKKDENKLEIFRS